MGEQSAPWHFSPNLPRKEWQGREGKWRMERKEGNLKGKRLEIDIGREGGIDIGRGIFFLSFFFFSFLLVTFWNHWNLFGSTKLGNFYREKANFTLGKFRKSDFAPSGKYSCYATALTSWVYEGFPYNILKPSLVSIGLKLLKIWDKFKIFRLTNWTQMTFEPLYLTFELMNIWRFPLYQ